jgi:hypothetical protein
MLQTIVLFLKKFRELQLAQIEVGATSEACTLA